MTTLLLDLRHALRLLAKRPAFTAVAVLTLALGIGANSAIFSVVDGLWLRFSRFPDAERLMVLWETFPGESHMSVALPNFRDWREQSQSFETLAAYRGVTYTLTGSGDPELVGVGLATADLFSTLGVEPLLGRSFSAQEDQPGAQVAVLSQHLWQRRFGADPGAVGRTVTLNGTAFTVLGVMPELRLESLGYADLWAPISLSEARLENRGRHSNTHAVGRLRPGVTLDQARAEMTTIAERLAAAYPQTNSQSGVSVQPLREQLLSDYKTALQVLWAAVTFVLLIACANVANLLLAQGSSRQQELAVRASLGAGRGRLLRLLLTESLVLGLAGGAGALLLALWGVDSLRAALGDEPQAQLIRLDGRVLGFTLLLAVGTSLLFGLAPVLQAWRLDVQQVLKTGTGGGAGTRLRQLLVAGQVALAVVLSIAAALMAFSLLRLHQVDPGFKAESVLSLELDLPAQRYADDETRRRFAERLLPELRAVAGVETAGVGYPLPMTGSRNATSVLLEGQAPPADGEMLPSLPFQVVSPGYLEALGIRVLDGRGFTDADGPDAPPVALVDRTLAEHTWPGESAVGKQLRLSDSDWIPIVGVVEAVQYQSPDRAPEPRFYLPFAQRPPGTFGVVLHTAGEPTTWTSGVRRAVARLDPLLAINDVQSMTARVAGRAAARRYPAVLIGLFAVLALCLAAVGIYGVVAYSVTQRTREIGLRMALGARREDVLWSVLRQGAGLALAGSLAGLAGAWALTRFLSSLLFQVQAADPATFAAVALGLVGIALLAGYPAARRAARVDPMTALRWE